MDELYKLWPVWVIRASRPDRADELKALRTSEVFKVDPGLAVQGVDLGDDVAAGIVFAATGVFGGGVEDAADLGLAVTVVEFVIFAVARVLDALQEAIETFNVTTGATPGAGDDVAVAIGVFDDAAIGIKAD